MANNDPPRCRACLLMIPIIGEQGVRKCCASLFAVSSYSPIMARLTPQPFFVPHMTAVSGPVEYSASTPQRSWPSFSFSRHALKPHMELVKTLETECGGAMLPLSDRASVKVFHRFHCRFDNPTTAAQESGAYGGQGKAAGRTTKGSGGLAVSDALLN